MGEKEKYNQTGRFLAGEDKNASPDGSFHEMKELWDLAGKYTYSEDVNTDQAWSQLKGKLTQEAPVKLTWIRRNAWAVAASVALLAVAGAGIWFLTAPAAKTEVASIHEKTGNREFKTVQLPDGSTIELNSNTEITVAADFNVSNRNITLTGEANFEVAPNAELPFIVTTGNATTRVVGTGFDIAAYKDEPVKIQVSHGKVKFGTADQNIMLVKGQAAQFDQTKNEVARMEANASTLAWQNENWVFKSTSLGDIATQIKHSFGKTLKYDEKYAGKLFTGKFNKNTSAEEMAKTISQALQITVTVE